jgi:nicotinate phosphoribosyltransferase
MNKKIITSLIDQDLYKISMMQAVFHQYPNAEVEYEFRCRNKDVKLGFLKDEVQKEIDSWDKLKIDEREEKYLRSLDFMKKDFVDFLLTFKLNPNLVFLERTEEDDLKITVKGKWLDTIWFEVPILATVNELYFNNLINEKFDGKFQNYLCNGRSALLHKINLMQDYPQFKFAEFGTRRRFSGEWQEEVVRTLVQESPRNIVGTSNIKLAMKYGIKPIGTVAHEFTMAHLGLVDNIRQAQARALHVWQQEYGSRLGIALTDTFTTDAFFDDFGFILARAYDGIRHDSGSPYEFADKAIAHYESIGIDPRRKSIIFSDGLDIPKALKIWKNYAGKIGISFGIGTSLSNDVGVPALNIVMKLLKCNGKHCIKLSDVSGKEMGDPETIEKVKRAYMVNR